MGALDRIHVGIVGTGYAAKLRAEAFQADERSRVDRVAGHSAEKTAAFAQTYDTAHTLDWQELVERPDLDLVVICNVNQAHGAIARAALQAGKHVVVEYPLSLDPQEAADLIALAHQQDRFLHVEHIELLGGVHQALLKNLPRIGEPFYARYSTLNPQRPAPDRWSYQPKLFGFPLVGALSRVHRLTHAFGRVATVTCQASFDSGAIANSSAAYRSCLCSAQLRFESGLIGEVVYGKGEALWQVERRFEVQGRAGALLFDGSDGTLIQGEGFQALEVGGRRGLFAKDTAAVLDHLLEGRSLYVSPAESLYALCVADAARRSAEEGRLVRVAAEYAALASAFGAQTP